MIRLILSMPYVVLISLLFSASTANAQVCRERITPQSISQASFVLDNAAFSVITGIKWQRCIYGQKWEPSRKACEGSPMLLTWSEALQVAANENLRLPNIKELNSILDLQCINPPFNLTIFPDTFASEDHGLWTSSPHVITTTADDIDKTKIWVIGLSLGRLYYQYIDTRQFAHFIIP